VLVSSRPETEWDETEQAWMLALAMYRETRCPGCGGDLNVTTKAEHEERYKAELPLQCFRCVAFSRSNDAYADQPYPGSLIHLVLPRPVR
jgi:hypothetical protein